MCPARRLRDRQEAEIQRFLNVAARYGYWNAKPEENARVGIRF